MSSDQYLTPRTHQIAVTLGRLSKAEAKAGMDAKIVESGIGPGVQMYANDANFDEADVDNDGYLSGVCFGYEAVATLRTCNCGLMPPSL